MRNHLLVLLFCLILSGLSFSQTPISILDARAVDMDGNLTNGGEMVELTGIAIGPNFRPSGHTWVLFDVNVNIGITVFDFGNDEMYDVTDGDSLRIIGEIDEFNGLAEIIPESIEVLSSGNAIPAPEVVTMLSEQTEAKLITIEDVMLVDPSQWGNGNFNVDLTDGNNTYQMRVDGDIDIAGMAAPQGTFNVTGIGGQFDNEAPLFNGYQIFPRGAMDIDPYDTGGNTGPTYESITIAQARETDGDFASTRINELVEITGIVHGVNFRPQGLQFSIIDTDNNGIGLFNSSGDLGYTFNEGDEITVWGRISQFSGLTQINPDSIDVVSQGNDRVDPIPGDPMGEQTESSLINITMAGWIDAGQWAGDGSSFNIDFLTIDGNTLTMRIDSDTELASLPVPPDGFSIVTGLGGQFDSSAPFDEGYQILPYRESDFEPYLSTDNLYEGQVNIAPNPFTDGLTIQADDKIDRLEIFDIMGRVVLNTQDTNGTQDLSHLVNGNYIIKLTLGEAVYQQKVVKQ